MIGRTADILEAAIEEFIDTGEPVSSGWLYRRYDFGIKPAMIRSELDGLSHRGFLEQPHHSAGRIPTDRGYEFFAERALERKDESLVSIAWALNLFRRNAWENLAEELSEQLGLAALVAGKEIYPHTKRGVAAGAVLEKTPRYGGGVYKTGIDELVENLDWDEPSEIKTAIHDFVCLEEKLLAAKRLFEETPRVFIGKKSPVTKSGGLAVVGGIYKSGDNEVFLLAIGPKRMDYRKTIKIFSALGGSVSLRPELGTKAGGKNTNGRTRK